MPLQITSQLEVSRKREDDWHVLDWISPNSEFAFPSPHFQKPNSAFEIPDSYSQNRTWDSLSQVRIFKNRTRLLNSRLVFSIPNLGFAFPSPHFQKPNSAFEFQTRILNTELGIRSVCALYSFSITQIELRQQQHSHVDGEH